MLFSAFLVVIEHNLYLPTNKGIESVLKEHCF